MKVYHVTSVEGADGIRKHAFKDSTGTYLTINEYTGVWVSDSPLDNNDMGGASDFCFEIEVEDESISEYEWVEDHKTYREWLIPSQILNRCPIRELTQEDVDEILDQQSPA